MPVYEPEKQKSKESPKEEPLKPIKEKLRLLVKQEVLIF